MSASAMDPSMAPPNTANNTGSSTPMQIETFHSFPVNQLQKFNIILAQQLKTDDLQVTIANPIIGHIDKQLEWSQVSPAANKCRVSFRVPMVGVYTFSIEHSSPSAKNANNKTPAAAPLSAEFQAKAYDLSKVFIAGSSGRCRVGEAYEFSVDASEAGEGQLEIAVNEGEIPNQVQVLDNGKCTVNFVPEEGIPHVVDIKFNGHNVNGCPFVVEVDDDDEGAPSSSSSSAKQPAPAPTSAASSVVAGASNSSSSSSNNKSLAATKTTGAAPALQRDERVLVDSPSSIRLANIQLNVAAFDRRDLLIADPENQPVDYTLKASPTNENEHHFQFLPKVVGDYSVELRPGGDLAQLLPAKLREQFPFYVKVFDHKKVLVSNVTDGVVGQPVYFFIDASQAGSGNLEIRVSSKSRNVPNYPQTEANARIRVNFTPSEPVDHTIDVKFNGLPVPNDPFLVKVAPYPQARLPDSSLEQLKYVAIDETIRFAVDYIGAHAQRLTPNSCQVSVLSPDFVESRLAPEAIELRPAPSDKQCPQFGVAFKPDKIGPYRLFVSVNNELIPASPLVSNVYNIEEVKVSFGQTRAKGDEQAPYGVLNKPVTFAVDASRAGEGTLSLAVLSGQSLKPVHTEVQVSDKGHGLYNLTFVPVEFAPHTIEMSFNERLVPGSPYIVDVLDAKGGSASAAAAAEAQRKQQQQLQQQKPEQQVAAPVAAAGGRNEKQQQQQQQLVQNFDAMSLKSSKSAGSAGASSSSSKGADRTANRAPVVTTKSKKSLAFGLVNASNVVYLESGVLENSKNQVTIVGPGGEKVPFVMGRAAAQPGEPKKTFIEYRPKSIGTHAINVLENGKDLRQYYVETCDPSLVRVTGLGGADGDTAAPAAFVAGLPISFCIDTRLSGEIQLDAINILPPGRQSAVDATNGTGGYAGLLGRIKSTVSSPHNSTSSSSSSSNNNNNNLTNNGTAAAQPIEYSIAKLNEHQQRVTFLPPTAGRYTIDARCLGQSIFGKEGPLEIEVLSAGAAKAPTVGLASKPSCANGALQPKAHKAAPAPASQTHHRPSMAPLSKEDELLSNIVVHGISLRCSPVNSTGAFIIETNRLAQAQDFDVLITDPRNSLVDVQCYLQQDGNLLAEWTPRRVGTHNIEVLYKNRPVPGSPFVSEAFDPSAVLIEAPKNAACAPLNERVEVKLTRRQAGHGKLDVAITSPVGQDLPIDIRPLRPSLADRGELGAANNGDDYEHDYETAAAAGLDEAPGELISFTPTVVGKYKMSITFGGYEVPKSPLTILARNLAPRPARPSNGSLAAAAAAADEDQQQSAVRLTGSGLKCAELNRSAQFQVESRHEGQLKLRIECGDREIVPKIETRDGLVAGYNYCHVVKYRPTDIGYATISPYWNGLPLPGSPFSVPVNDLSKVLFLSGTNKASSTGNQRIIDYEPHVPKEITLDTSNCGPGELKAEAHCRAKPALKFALPTAQYMHNRWRLTFCYPPPAADQLVGAGGALALPEEGPPEASFLVRLYYNNLSIPEALGSVVVSPAQSCRGAATASSSSAASCEGAASGAASLTRRPETNNNTNANNNNNNHNHTGKQHPPVGNKNPRTLNGSTPNTTTATVSVRGPDVTDLRCGERVWFAIEASQPGKPEVRLGNGAEPPVKVRLEPCDDSCKAYQASFVAQQPGNYALNVFWDGQQVPGYPVQLEISAPCDPTKVLCTGDGLKGGILGEEIKTFIDTRRAGPGELTALCTGPTKVAFCELLDRGDGTFILYIKPQEAGKQLLTVKYGGQHIPKSPFVIKISGRPDPTKVRVYGPGIEHGVLSLYQSRFVCDTRGAGAGQLTVRIRGPKGAFRMETQRESQRDRNILCKYDPTEPGDYRIEIKWSGKHVPGSPFSVMIFDTQEELNRFLRSF